ncbi:hypothetical protein [Cryobacterium sp. PH31-L1]|uniref:hypothetical protein n=1 Tax=Cryobacterium sp. PH31-L1 TaxID=3046199 RepID=UPI0024BAE7C3|nr:hypothetical protein [Cryobacterium sp. PH31-L1]MDJ0379033.1 hypothetical protein [Cryobacterium sp. PH31-L1]
MFFIEPPRHESRDRGIPHAISSVFGLRQAKNSSNKSVFGGEVIVQLDERPERPVGIVYPKVFTDRFCRAGSVVSTSGSGIEAVPGAGEQPINGAIRRVSSTLMMGDAGLIDASQLGQPRLSEMFTPASGPHESG